jgi:hypothetical protein
VQWYLVSLDSLFLVIVIVVVATDAVFSEARIGHNNTVDKSNL